jgi:hypothetical protein
MSQPKGNVYKLKPRTSALPADPDGTKRVYRDTETQNDTEDSYLCVVNQVSREEQPRTSRESFLAFISYACEESRRLVETRKADGQGWQSSTFHFVRLCRTRPEFEGMNGDSFFNGVPWHATDFDEDEVLTATVEWGKVKTKAGDNPIMTAVLLATEKPVLKGERFRYFKNYALFLNIAYHLQCLLGDSDIYLPVHRLAVHLAVTARVVSQYRFMGRQEGFLKETVKHTKKRATRFRVNLERFSTGRV